MMKDNPDKCTIKPVTIEAYTPPSMETVAEREARLTIEAGQVKP